MKLLFTFLLLSSVCLGQSKKDQIIALNKSIDSLNTVLSTTRDNASKEANTFNATNKKITDELTNLQTSNAKVTEEKKIFQLEINKLTKDISEQIAINKKIAEGTKNSLAPFYIYYIGGLWEVPDEIQNSYSFRKPPINVSGLCLELFYCPYIEGVRFNLGRYENGKKQGEWISNSPDYIYVFDGTDYYTPAGLDEWPLDETEEGRVAYAVLTYKDDNLLKESYTNQVFEELAYSIEDNLGEVAFFHPNSTLLFESSRDKMFYNNGNIAREKNLSNGNFIFYNRAGNVSIEEPGDIFEIGRWDDSWPCQ